MNHESKKPPTKENQTMQIIKPIRRAAGIFIMAVTAISHAQGIDTDEARSTIPASTSNANKKAVRAENRKLQKEVLRNLTKTKGLNASNIVVVARSGVVTLGGSVPEANEAELATAIARGVAGVTEVKSNLAVRPEGL
ncbi:BON domain-containing protein [Paraburkholderia tagetis]|uniref:BON domain-containing protein n=1 Tax=Paraburkholderia tagetis TaxID=2913261 RepID=A0A9X1UE46_9BURK|nr:BON domain-containing protein [Paraburkholderia tagetis]MCG5073269.1 BON domain-containing protein [Paraburkholderia tagetis]